MRRPLARELSNVNIFDFSIANLALTSSAILAPKVVEPVFVGCGVFKGMVVPVDANTLQNPLVVEHYQLINVFACFVETGTEGSVFCFEQGQPGCGVHDFWNSSFRKRLSERRRRCEHGVILDRLRCALDVGGQPELPTVGRGRPTRIRGPSRGWPPSFRWFWPAGRRVKNEMVVFHDLRTPVVSAATRSNGFLDTAAPRCSRVAAGTTEAKLNSTKVSRSAATATKGT